MTDMPTSDELDRMFDEGVDMTPYMDLDHAQMTPPRGTHHEGSAPVIMWVSIDPGKVVAIDRRAQRRGKTRDELVNDAIDALLATPA